MNDSHSDFTTDWNSDTHIIQYPLPPTDQPTLLPTELASILNETYFLHLLATDPAAVLPPGKSLVSALSTTHDRESKHSTNKQDLRGKVEDAVHKAFWDEVREKLSSNEPSIQIPRIQKLYQDLFITLTPLLPPKHPTLTLLSSPLSPTPAPLLTLSNHLREVLATLLTRCAPERDERIHILMRSLDFVSFDTLQNVVADTTKAIFELADIMKDDLAKFIFGAMNEDQLKASVSQQAQEREIAVVIQLWSHGLAKTEWVSWLKHTEPTNDPPAEERTRIHAQLSRRLLEVLQSTSPAICPLPSRPLTRGSSPVDDRTETEQPTPHITSNILPGLFLFVAPIIHELQNRLQALVIAACLRSLSIAFRAEGSHPALHLQDNDFMARIWTLLESEISITQDIRSEGLKLANLADELISQSRAAAGVDACRPGANTYYNGESEKRLRSAVDRTLRTQDPVFLLLQKRLFDALIHQMCQPPSREAEASPPSAPERLRSGRGLRSRPNNTPYPLLRVNPQSPSISTPRAREVPVIKGFEDPIIHEALNKTFDRLMQVTEWILGLLDTEEWHSARNQTPS